MLTVELKINGRLIGRAVAVNRSGGARVSNYFVDAYADGSEFAPAIMRQFTVTDHERWQTAWALVAKIADIMCEAADIMCEAGASEGATGA